MLMIQVSYASEVACMGLGYSAFSNVGLGIVRDSKMNYSSCVQNSPEYSSKQERHQMDH